jgi:hypothetical protein
VILIVVINAWYATGLRFLSNSVQHAVEPVYAAAYVADHDPELAIPVQSIVGASIRDTGAKVLFYIRNDYCGVPEYTPSRLTLLIVALGGLIFWLVGTRSSGSNTS